jgi:hypothetical protein
MTDSPSRRNRNRPASEGGRYKTRVNSGSRRRGLENVGKWRLVLGNAKGQLELGRNHGALDWIKLQNKGAMKRNSIVIVSLHSPKEKIWGILLDINVSGVTLRGIDLNSFDHFVSEINQIEAERIGLPTVFFPMTRVERISLDEPSGSIPSMAEIFERKIGRTLFDYLAQFA